MSLRLTHSTDSYPTGQYVDMQLHRVIGSPLKEQNYRTTIRGTPVSIAIEIGSIGNGRNECE